MLNRLCILHLSLVQSRQTCGDQLNLKSESFSDLFFEVTKNDLKAGEASSSEVISLIHLVLYISLVQGFING